MTRLALPSGLCLDVTDLGSGPAVVLVPGVGMSHEVFDRQLRVVAASGRRAICVDQRGHGASDKPWSGYGIDDLAGDLAAVLDGLGLAGVALVGWSLGAQVAVRTTLDRPDLVGRLVLLSSNGVAAARTPDFPFGAPVEDVAPALRAAEHAHRVSARRRAIVSAFASPPDEDVVRWLLRVSLQMPSWASLELTDTLLRSCSAARVAELAVPVLQVRGDRDPVLSSRGAAWLQERLPSLSCVVLEGCGHYPMLEAPDELEAALLDFLPLE